MVGVILIASISTRSYAETYDEWNIDEEMKKPSNTKYEDNSAFMPNRFLYSKKTCKSFISNYVKNDASFNVNY